MDTAPDAPFEEDNGIREMTATAQDRLRLIADTVEGQQPLGTELADFRRRLLLILNL